ncbi:MAG: hypothetical protein IKD52_08810 [Exiguobacterium sp.]|nr:hypothetical protein [Exiguobacterium sp.]MBR2758159.1 hypothetical protein [Exiguobacterium sp.]MBR3216294.1 hypothetical protein [Exiguobacterium sp.]
MKQSIQLNHGQKVIPAIGLGVFNVEDGDTVIDAVVGEIRQGYRHIDTAAVYENEEGFGVGIRKGMGDYFENHQTTSNRRTLRCT